MTDAMDLPTRESGGLPFDEEVDSNIPDEVEEDKQSWEEAGGSKMMEELLGTFNPSLADEATPPQAPPPPSPSHTLTLTFYMQSSEL